MNPVGNALPSNVVVNPLSPFSPLSPCLTGDKKRKIAVSYVRQPQSVRCVQTTDREVEEKMGMRLDTKCAALRLSMAVWFAECECSTPLVPSRSILHVLAVGLWRTQTRAHCVGSKHLECSSLRALYALRPLWKENDGYCSTWPVIDRCASFSLSLFLYTLSSLSAISLGRSHL